MTEPATFLIKYGVFRFLLSILGLGPAFSGVDVTADEVRVRMGYAFRGKIPRSSITGVELDTGSVGGIGVHGRGRGRWLVNGAASGLVKVTIDPAARAIVLGFPAQLRELRVSVVDPDALVAALSR